MHKKFFLNLDSIEQGIIRILLYNNLKVPGEVDHILIQIIYLSSLNFLAATFWPHSTFETH